MSGIIEGYNYDIFISYRQKDNKGDRWVTEFVENLKGELESTFKEEISVYFDINPHDGLLETHDVDASLKEKLKCLVFIPIISRTYCDPKSFAWEHEFIAFIEQASNDQFGLKVKLPNGNVASRVLPVRIHDLDIEDIKQCESVLGSVIRGIEFIYKEPGVNKPLTYDDDEKKNLNNTKYRIQVNKTALAIKEIILGLKAGPSPQVTDKTQRKEFAGLSIESKKPDEEQPEGKKGKSRVLSGTLILALLLIVAIFFYPKIFKRDKFDEIKDPDGRISIAILPFENLTGDSTLNWFQKGISSLIINGLGNSAELAVFDDHTMHEMMERANVVYTAGFSPSVAREVAKKAKAETYISGNFQGREDTYWIMANLVNTETGNVLWTNKVEGNLRSSVYLSMADSLCNEIKNYLELKALGDVAGYDFREVYPTSAEAYRHFIEGMNLVLAQNLETGIRSLKMAYEIDSTFTLVSFYLALANNLSNQGSFEQTLFWTNKAFLSKERIPAKYQTWVELWHACLFSKNFQDINRYCTQLQGSGINSRLFWFDLGATYCDFLHNYNKAVEAFEKVLAITTERGDSWKFPKFWDRFLLALHRSGDHVREKQVADIGLNAIPGYSNWIYYWQSICAFSLGDTLEANKILEQYLAKHKELGTPERTLNRYLSQIYEETKMMDQAEMLRRKEYEITPQSLGSVYYLANFLIMNDIGIEEGMELVLKGLAIDPNHFNLLRLKGIGLFKQGEHEEALKVLSEAWDKSPYAEPVLFRYLEETRKAVASQKN